MAGRETPRRVVDPSPAPWRDPDPSAIGVRRPARRDVRVPHLAITGDGVPTTMGIELHIARHVGRDVVGRGEALPVIVARPAPFHKRVGNRLLECGRHGVDPAQHRDIAGFDDDVGTASDKLRAPFEHCDTRRLILGPGIDVVISRLQEPDGAAGDVDLDALALIQPPQVKVDASLRDIEPADPLVEGDDVELGVARHRDRIRGDPDLGAGLGVGPQ